MRLAPMRPAQPTWLAGATLWIFGWVFTGAAAAQPPAPRCAATVVAYSAGTGAGLSYQNPAAALGPPTQITGVGAEAGAVTPFRPAYMPGEIVSIGRGGELVLRFAAPVFDDPRNPYGVDLIVYGNSMLSDLAYPGGVAGFLFEEGGTIELSADGIEWHRVQGAADGGLPTMAFADAGPYQATPGRVPCDPALPADPTIVGDDVIGLDYWDLQALYGGACGGTRVDLGTVGLQWAQYVRIRVALDAASVPEVDAVVAVRPGGQPADLNGDGRVDGADLGLLLGAWSTASPADLNGDGTVDGADLGALLGSWSA